MQVYLVRHALATMREKFDGPDEERPLTKKGVRKMARIARGLAQQGMSLTHVYTSPMLRALQTAEIIQKKQKIHKVEQTPLMMPEARLEDLLALLNEHAEEDILALIGHEPHLSALLAYLVSGEPHAFTSFKKGGVALVEGDKPVHAGDWQLRWLLEPNQLVALAEV